MSGKQTLTGAGATSEAAQAQVFAFLADPATHGLDRPVERIDTAAAVVFLAGPTAYKVKRAVRFPFMDLSTLERRRSACAAEIDVNRPNAPDLYLGAEPIVRRGSALAIGGEGEIVEWTVRMRRFDETQTLDRLADRGPLAADLMDRLAVAVRASHARAPLRDAAPAIEELALYLDQNEVAFGARNDLFPGPAARRLAADSRLALAAARPVLVRRGAAGLVRRCHGDLHLRNIVVLDGAPTLFDAVEFSDAVATGDVLYDLAFLLMDLENRGQRAAANRLFNRYFAAQDASQLDGLAALPLFLSLRAAIRAKVEAARGERLKGAGRNQAEAQARRYFEDAAEFLRYAPARLVAVGGLSGAGKSALAAVLAPKLGRPPGALVVRSDVERKCLYGVAETSPLPASAYRPEVSREVYRRIEEKALVALRAGQSVALDATFRHATERAQAADVAATIGCAFDGLWLEAPLATRLERIGARAADASDADAAVARTQRVDPLAGRGWKELDAEGDIPATLARAAQRLGV